MARKAVCWCVIGSSCFLLAVPAGAQDGAGGEAPDGGGTNADGNAVDPGSPQAVVGTPIRFTFRGASFQQVVEFFSRTTGMPVIWETDPPAGTLDYISPESYTRDEGLSILNIILQSKGVMLRVESGMLYLQKLAEMQREDIPTYIGEIPADVPAEQIVTVVRPLSIALANSLAERLAAMVASYGSVTAMPQQNSLLITETAAQVRRLSLIIDELDRADPEGVVEIIPIVNVSAKDILVPLQALLAQKVEKYVLDQKGNQIKVEDTQMPGLNITPDERTNSVIAKGTEARIAQLKEAIKLLDVPALSRTRTLRTVALSRLAPKDAAKRVDALFAKLPAERQPTTIPLDEIGSLTIVGEGAVVEEAIAFLRDADGGVDDRAASGERVIVVVPVERANPEAIGAALRPLLDKRRQAVLTFAPGTDGRSLVVAGPAADVEMVASLVPTLDRPPRIDRDARVVRIDAPDPDAAVERARALYEQTTDRDDPAAALNLDWNRADRALTLVGSRAAIDRFTGLLRTAQDSLRIATETRQVRVANAEPARIAVSVRTLAAQLLRPRDGAAWTEPAVEPVDALDLLLVTARPEDLAAIESIVQTLDRPGPDDFAFRIVSASGVTDVPALLERAAAVFAALSRGHEGGDLVAPTVQHDAATGNLVVSGLAEPVRLYEQAIQQARNLLPPPRTGELIALQFAQADAVVEPLRELVAKTVTTDGSRLVEPPRIESIERTNSLYVVAEPAQHAAIRTLLRELDVLEPRDLPPLQLIQVRVADAAQIANMLRSRYDQRPAEQRRESPVSIEADAATNTLVVTAHESISGEIRKFVDEINRADVDQATKETMIFPLRRARAQDLSQALERLYPDPPVPLDRRGRPLPDLRPPREVYVSADPATNTLIVEAPPERRASFEALVEQLDRVELPPTAQLRTYRVERGDPNAIARTLQELSRRGVMAEQPADGTKPVEVLVQAEPLSRTLIVAGDEVTFRQTESILKDLQAVPVERTLRVFEIVSGDPRELADRAQRLYAEQSKDDPDAKPVSVEIDGGSGALLVVAENDALMRFAGILDQLEQAAGAPPEITLIPLEHANATEVAEWLTDLAESHFRLVGGRVTVPPTFEAIERTNSILVAGRNEQFEIVRALVRGLDRPDATSLPPLRILQLRTADAASLAAALKSKYDRRPLLDRNERVVDISADPQTNALFVAAHPDLFPEIEAIVRDLNQVTRLDTEGREIRIFPLKVARAEELAQTLDEMFPEPPIPVDSRGRPMPQAKPAREVVVRADSQTNSIIVDAPVQRMTGFEALVEQLDRQKIGSETEIRTYPVVNADIDALVATLKQLAQSGTLAPAGQDRRTQITISSESASRTIVVSGPTEIFARVEQVLGDLDVKPAMPATRLRFFKLEHARADTVATMLREVLVARLDEMLPGGMADQPSVLSITADRKTNTLIVSAPEAVLAVAEEVVQQLDLPGAAVGDAVIRVRPLVFADADTVANAIRAALPGVTSRTTGEPLDCRLVPAPGANAIILVGIAADLDEVEALVEPLDARPSTDAIDARTFALRHAEAASIASLVRNLLEDQQATDPRLVLERIRRSRGQVDLTPRIRVEADARTNSLVVSGPQRTVALADSLIEQLDQPQGSGERVYRTFTPRAADPTTLADVVRRVVQATRPAGGRATVELIAEPRSGAVLVVGDRDEVESAMTVLAERDAQAIAPPEMDLKLFALEHASADTVARSIGLVLDDPARWPEELRAAQRAGLPVARPSVVAEPQANRLLVAAPKPLLALAAQLVAELDQVRDAGAQDVRVFTLQSAKSERVAEAIRATLETIRRGKPGLPPISVVAEPSSNAVVVAAATDELAAVQDVVERLDRGISADVAQVRSVFLKHARAESVAAVVESLLVEEETDPFAGNWWNRRAPTDANEKPKVRVAADARLNAVLVSAPVAVLNVAEQMIAQLDAEAAAAGGTTRTVRLLTLRSADAVEVAKSLGEVFADGDTAEPPPVLRVDAQSNSLVVRATPTQHETIADLVERIDRATVAGMREMRVVPIDPSRAAAADVARALQQMLERGEGSVEVMTLDELLRRTKGEATAPASDGAKDGAKDDRGAPKRGAMAPLPLPAALAAAVLAAAPEDDALPPTADVSIAVDPTSNAIVIVGAPRQLERLEALARTVAERLPAPADRLRYVALPPSASARLVAEVAQRTLQQLRPAGGNRGDLAKRASVLADESGNALLIACADADFALVGEVVATLASGGTADRRVVKVYPLRSITAERASSSIEGLLGEPRGGRGRGRQAERMRELALTLLGAEEAVEAVFDPSEVSVVADPEGNALVVAAPAEALPLLDGFVELIDQAPAGDDAAIRVLALRSAKASELERTISEIFRGRARALRERSGVRTPEPEIAADDRTNRLVVTADPRMLGEIEQLVQQLDVDLGDERHPLRIVDLKSVAASSAASLIDKAVIGTDQDRRTRTLVVPDEASGLLLVRASDEVNAEIDRVLSEIDRNATDAFPVRTIVLERADAGTVSAALQRFFDDRAKIASSGRGRREQARRVSIVGDQSTRTLLIAAADEDYVEIERLVAQFDSPQATDQWSFRVFPLRHAKASDIQESVNRLLNDLTWNQGPIVWGPRGPAGGQSRGSAAVRADERLNALIATGEGDKFEIIQQLVEALDAPQGDAQQRIVRVYRPRGAKADTVRQAIESVFGGGRQRNDWWWFDDFSSSSGAAPKVLADSRTNTLVIAATAQEQEEIARIVEGIDADAPGGPREVEAITLAFAEARELAQTLERFVKDLAESEGRPDAGATIMASTSVNAIVVAADAERLALVRDLVQRLDQPDLEGDRAVEIVALRRSEPDAIARILEGQFPKRGGQGVLVTPDPRTKSIVINAPGRQMEQVRALVAQLDAPTGGAETVIRTYALKAARADEVVRLLTDSLQLDARGETKGVTVRLDDADEPVEVRGRIGADRRSNSLVVTATPESIPVIEALVAKLDEVPAAAAVEYRIMRLSHAMADDVSLTLGLVGTWGDGPRPSFDYNRLENQLIVSATADQLEQIERIVQQLDVPSEKQRVTDFVPLQYAEAEQIQAALAVFYGPFAIEADTPGKRNVRIVADPATNSLVISADETEWENIRSFLGRLDAEEYDSSLQLRVLPLDHADARSVARAINDAFGDRGQRDARGQRTPPPNQPGDRNGETGRRDQEAPTVLVEADEWVRASAEPLTNSVIVSASRQNLRKIEAIVDQLDVADYARLPAPRVIRVTQGDPQTLADAISRLYAQEDRGRDPLRIVGDRAAGVLVVRVEDEEYGQIAALAEALQQETDARGVAVEVVRLESAPAPRVAAALREAYAVKAREAKQPLSIQVDAGTNSLVVAAPSSLAAEVRATAAELDALAPGAGQNVFIIDLKNVSPEAAEGVIRSIGLDKPPAADSAARLVSEPIKVTRLAGRNALVVVANPADRETIVSVLKAIDADPALAESQMRLIPLRHAQAGALADILSQVLDPSQQQANTPLARAVQEQVRRLVLRRDGADEPDVALDLSVPLRLVPAPGPNALLVSSTPANVKAVEALVALFDSVPITDAVTVQIFPLDNIAASDFVRIVQDLLQQGKALARLPGSAVQGVPAGMLGQAILDTVALSADDRTNAVVAAGREESVAFVEVLKQRLDSEMAIGWLEPRVVPLRYADANDLAESIDAILVRGAGDLPQSTPLQRQVGRIRMARSDGNGGRVLESDVFAPMTRLVVRPEPQLNALVLVGSPTNLEVVTELVALLDVEAASPDATVRIYPVEHASAERLQAMIQQLFEAQVRSKRLRPEDRVVVQADLRTNSLVVSTSTRSFAVLEGLLKSLDGPMDPDLREIRTLELEHASATRLASLAQQLMDARLERLRRLQPESADLEKVAVLADPRTNSLIVNAGNEAFDVIRRLVEQLDRADLDDVSGVEIITLAGGNADRIRSTIEAVMERRYAELPPEIRRSQAPLVQTDPRTNSLIVAANPEDLASIRALVTRLEAAPTDPAVGVHVVSLPSAASASEIGPRIERLMQDRARTLGEARKPSDEVTVEADERGNTLIVAASPENAEIVRGLVDLLVDAGAAAEAGRVVEVIPLVSGRAADVRDLVQEIYVDEENDRRGGRAVQLTADERTNALVVNGTGEDVRQVKEIVARLDEAKPAAIVEIKYIALQSANALETVSLINNILSGRGVDGRRGGRQATVLRYLHELEDAEEQIHPEMEVSAAIRESITLTPDVRTNTIIVSAPGASMPLIERMIRDLDDTNTGAKSIRVFKLANADATAMREILFDLFNLRQGSDLLVLKPRESDAAAGAGLDGGLLGGADLTAVPDERQQLSITVDSRTNSLLVSGTPRYLDLVEEVVNELDALEANEREVYVYQLRNAKADEVARVLADFVEEEQRKLVETLSSDQLGSAARLLEREITIRGDAKSNSVLVSASPRYMNTVKDMLAQLDVDPPQVLIQVMLAEVTLDSSDDWGFETGGEVRIGSATINGAFGFAATAVPGIGVPTLTVATSDFNLLFRALQSQGRIQVLSNPSVMAANNEPAELQIGETIRVATVSQITDTGNTNTQTEDKELGVVLTVEPSINPDGFVRMSIEPRIEDLTNRTVQISENLESPVITVRRASTTVTVQDGQTVVIGGLIQDRYERRTRKVPFFGDIPLVGALFRSEEEEIKKTEFLIVLRPHVIYSPSDGAGSATLEDRRRERDERMRDVTEGEVERISVPDMIQQMIRDGRLDADQLYDAEGRRIEIETDRANEPRARRAREVVPPKSDAPSDPDPGTPKENPPE